MGGRMSGKKYSFAETLEQTKAKEAAAAVRKARSNSRDRSVHACLRLFTKKETLNGTCANVYASEDAH